MKLRICFLALRKKTQSLSLRKWLLFKPRLLLRHKVHIFARHSLEIYFCLHSSSCFAFSMFYDYGTMYLKLPAEKLETTTHDSFQWRRFGNDAI